MKRKSILATSVLALHILLSSCASLTGTNDAMKGSLDAVTSTNGRYDTPVTVTAVRYISPVVKFPQGDDIENNIWTRAFEEHLNIKLKYLWTVPSSGEVYDQKINIAIASNDLPDIMPVYTSLYEKLAQADKLYDLTDVLEEHGSDRLKDNLSAFDGRALTAATRNGKLTGIGILPSGTEPSAMIWVRDDWMSNLKLEPPKTMDDFLNMARAFANEDPDGNGSKDTWGFAFDKDLRAISAIFNAYHAYDKIWLDRDGSLQFSSTLPEVKKPLEVLHGLFADKILDPEFAYKTESDQIKADIIAGRLGMIIGDASSPMVNVGAAYQNDGVNWTAYPIPSCDEKPVLLQMASRVQNFVAVNKDSIYPDAMIKIMNLITEIKQGSPSFVTDNGYHTTKEGYMAFFYPPVTVPVNQRGGNVVSSQLVEAALETGDISALNQEQLSYYKKVKGFIDKTEDGDWATYKVFGPGGSISISANYKEQNNMLFDEDFLAETPSWSQNGSNLFSRTDEFYMMSILEGNIDKAFDDYVSYFESQGGAEATEEVNNLYKGRPRLNK